MLPLLFVCIVALHAQKQNVATQPQHAHLCLLRMRLLFKQVFPPKELRRQGRENLKNDQSEPRTSEWSVGVRSDIFL